MGCWSEEETVAVQVAVGMGDRAFVTESACHGVAHGFFRVVEQREGKMVKWRKWMLGKSFRALFNQAAAHIKSSMRFDY